MNRNATLEVSEMALPKHKLYITLEEYIEGEKESNKCVLSTSFSLLIQEGSKLKLVLKTFSSCVGFYFVMASSQKASRD
jgi:hypothetical protein